MTQNQNPKPIGTRYVVRASDGRFVAGLSVNQPWFTSYRNAAMIFDSLKVASQVSDAIGGEVVDV